MDASKFGLSLVILTVTTFTAISQTSFDEYKRQAHEQFQQFKEQKQSEFEAYRDRVNQDFAEFMQQAWPSFETKPAIPASPKPEPPKPVVAKPNDKPSNEPLPFAKVEPLPSVLPPPSPMLPAATPQKPSAPLTPVIPDTPTKPQPAKPVRPQGPSVTFDFYGQECVVPFDNTLKISLRSNDEKNVAKAWKQLAGNESIELIESCINLRDCLSLSDWGYLRLVQKLSEAAFPGRKDEAALLQMFILTQSGYKVRIGRNGDRLIVLIPSKEKIYNYQFIPIGGMNYYIVDRNLPSRSTQIFNHEFPREQMFSLYFRSQPTLPIDAAPAKTFKSTYGDGVSADIAVNRNLIAFYNDYPLSSHWDMNAKASLSEDVKAQLYPALQEAIADKSQTEAANIMLRFVQTAFAYMTDDKQFGIERSLFPDETFNYPYSDCEDRAILYAVLVRELLGLDAVLVNYPQHLATAVKFDGDVNGDYFNIDGQKYIVCDPTYINADIGMAMPMYKTASADIVKL